MQLAWIVLGGLLPLAVAYSLGKLCFRQAPDVIALGAGAVIESLIVFGLLAAGVAEPPAFVAVGVIGLLPLAWLRPRALVPMPRGVIASLPYVFFVCSVTIGIGVFSVKNRSIPAG